ncbi:hypothetical protein LTS07_002851 [Exophiala sideris]|uniref:Uncharacterized protein n=1 Tax=Exophiala sideris TaxID=1016849 RepID=A0ABR0JKA5_9EURO|nr:hypothetical protein LTS07_002851 [Exophiala sideris]KAK5039235.1 hypothetical protein LTR13_003491 [Exophiala sideris]KAK5066338.1 hypothetical protein LTR69_002857 [Exophiala sideris]KAK5187015.1 hypothetical protein LTR44_001022 [Eurotiomycetes sp. CCFEE 6388]
MHQFKFINQDASNRSLSKSDHSTIRSVSRRVGAATRREKNAGTRTNALQIPDFLVASEGESSTSTSTSTAHVSHIDDPPEAGSKTDSHYQTPALALSGRRQRDSAARATSLVRYTPNGRSIPQDVRIFMLPGLTAKLLARVVSTDVHNNQLRWAKRYGHSRCLDDAIACVAGRVRLSLVEGDHRHAQWQIDRLYGRALRSLNAALSSDCVDWTAWYATMLLLLFEILDNDSAHGWIMHAWGGIRVLLALGPDQIITETDKDLLVISAELIILEATFGNIDCFLSQPKWQKALEATIVRSPRLIDRSEATVTLWMILARAPNLFRSVTKVVVQQRSHPQDELVRSLRDLIDELSKWGARWNKYLPNDSDPETRVRVSSTESARRRHLSTRYLTFLALANRCLCAIEPASGAFAEQNAFDAASAIALSLEVPNLDTVSGLGLKLADRVAQSIQDTAADWSYSMSLRTLSNSQTIDAETFSSWCVLLGKVV